MGIAVLALVGWLEHVVQRRWGWVLGIPVGTIRESHAGHLEDPQRVDLTIDSAAGATTFRSRILLRFVPLALALLFIASMYVERSWPPAFSSDGARYRPSPG